MAFGERTRLDGGAPIGEGYTRQEWAKKQAIIWAAGLDMVLPEPKLPSEYSSKNEQSSPQQQSSQNPGGVNIIQYFGQPPAGPAFYPTDQPVLDTNSSLGSQFDKPAKPIVKVQTDPLRDVLAQIEDMGLVVKSIEDEDLSPTEYTGPKQSDDSEESLANDRHLRQLIDRYLPTKRRQVAAVGALALLLSSPFYNSRAHDIAASIPLIGSQFSTVEAIDAFDGSVLTPEESEKLINFLESALKMDKAELLATTNIGTTETAADGTVQNAFNQPVELTTEVGVLTGDAVNLKIINTPELKWQIKVPEPKFSLSSGGKEKTAFLSIDPSSLIVFPQIEATKTEWNTVNPDLIAAKLRELNPSLTDEQIAAARAKADADLASSQAAVANKALLNAVEQLTASPEVINALNKGLLTFLPETLSNAAKGFNDLNMGDYELKLCFSDDETKCSPKIEVSAEKILKDYEEFLASNEVPAASPNVKLTQTVNGLNIAQPQEN